MNRDVTPPDPLEELLRRIVVPATPDSDGSGAHGLSIEAYEAESRNYDLQAKAHSLRERREASKQRVRYARRVYALVALWICGLFVILICQATVPFWHPLANNVLIALITSTTANLIATLVIVLNYIFKLPDDEK